MSLDSVASNTHGNLDEQISQLMQCKPLSEQEVILFFFLSKVSIFVLFWVFFFNFSGGFWEFSSIFLEKWCGSGWDCQGWNWEFMIKISLFCFLKIFWIILKEFLLFWGFEVVFGEMVWIWLDLRGSKLGICWFFFVSCVWCNLCFEGIMRDLEADLWLVGADLSMGFAFRMFFLWFIEVKVSTSGKSLDFCFMVGVDLKTSKYFGWLR